MLMRIRWAGVDWRDISTATVAAASAARTKKCHGRKPASVEVAELIVQPRREIRGGDLRLCRRRVGGFVAARPAQCGDGDTCRTGRTDQVWEKPRQAIEALVDRGGKDLLAAELLDERGDDRVVVLALAEILAQLRGLA